ncbi:hypothetical protein EV356DRAFT_505270 [Viridothelium virens]|uniref:TOM core complex subunit Tom6 n=1 Tax=Viridothelium virens TaxID=1048519 RepID=A0A6A6H3E8_VIRVR|nr:hypothetical protein EV356DRAFT_505270 [Viridothelium virens]
MPPKRVPITTPAGRRGPQDQGYFRNVMNEVSNPENRAVLTAVGMFAVSVAFLHSSWSEILLPPV